MFNKDNLLLNLNGDYFVSIRIHLLSVQHLYSETLLPQETL